MDESIQETYKRADLRSDWGVIGPNPKYRAINVPTKWLLEG